jgi:NADPH-dependent curcumin reductase
VSQTTTTTTANRRIVLNSRPLGAPTSAYFRLVSEPVPKLGAGQVLLRTPYLSLDPYMRGLKGKNFGKLAIQLAHE